jgi:thioredoxin 1
MKIYSVIIFILTAVNFSGYSQEVPDSVMFRSLLPKEFHLQLIKEDTALLIDVREFFEYRGKRLSGAINMPSSGNLDLAADTINKETSLFLYCYSGTRSERVARLFYKKGFRKLYSLEGGIMRWRKEKMPVAKGKVKRKA